MSEIKEPYLKEKTFEFMQNWNEFAFALGYQYSKGFEDKPNIIYLHVAFWNLNFAW